MDDTVALVQSKRGDGGLTGRDHRVNVAPVEDGDSMSGVCDCGVPRVLGVPCSHVIAACEVDIDHPVDPLTFVDPVLTMEAMRAIYTAMGRTETPGTSRLRPDKLKCPSWTRCRNVVAADNGNEEVFGDGPDPDGTQRALCIPHATASDVVCHAY